MDNFKEKKKFKYLYGPVPSWRLGSSLGIDLLFGNKKTCTFDCVYCQLGETPEMTKERRIYAKTEKVIEEMDNLTRGLRESEKPVDPKELLAALSEGMGETIDLFFAERILDEADEIKKELLEMNRPPISYLSSLGKFFTLFIEAIGKEEYFHMLETGKNRHGHKTIKLGVVALDPQITSKEIRCRADYEI